MGSSVTVIPAIEVDLAWETIRIDMTRPAIFKVIGINPLTGQSKIYMLKVSEKSLCLT
jgi:hypothetical protein